MSDDDLTPDRATELNEREMNERELDELLSAELDGELGTAAADLGLALEAARARIDATAGADDRRRAIAAARDALGELPEIDELLAARLRAKAVRAGAAERAAHDTDRKRRRRRAFAAMSAVAAAIAAIAGIAAAANGQHGRSEASGSKAASVAPPSTPVASKAAAPKRDTASAAQSTQSQDLTIRPALGPFPDVRTLALAAVHRAETTASGSSAAYDTAGAVTTTFGHAPTSENGVGSGQVAAPSVPASKSLPATGANKALGRDGECEAPAQVPDGDTLVLTATATLAAKPVNVSVYAGAGEHVVVIEDFDCRLVNLQMMS